MAKTNGFNKKQERGNGSMDTNINNTSTIDELKNSFNTINDTRGDTEETVSFSNNVLGLDNSLMYNVGKSVAVTTFAEKAKEASKDFNIELNIFKLERDLLDGEYGGVLFTHLAKDGVVYSFLIILGDTGREPLTVTQVVAEQQIRNSDAGLVTADIFSKHLYDKLDEIVYAKFGEKNHVSLDGFVVPNSVDLEDLGESIALYAQYLIAARVGQSDVTIDDLNNYCKANNMGIGAELSLCSGTVTNKIGKPVRTDFILTTHLKSKTQIRGFSGNRQENTLISTTGMIDYIVGKDINKYTQQPINMAEPIIRLNGFGAAGTSIRYVLLSIINSAVFASPTTLKQMIIANDPGSLNYLLNYGGEANALGEKMSFKDEKMQPQVLNDIIAKHYKLNPIYTLEIEYYGADYSYLKSFSALLNPKLRSKATKYILEEASELLNYDLPEMSIMANSGSHIPVGEFKDAEGNVRDLNEIDSVFISEHTNDIKLLADWNTSNTPTEACQNYTGKDPYTLKLEVLNKLSAMLNFEIKITGKASLITINPMFIKTLVDIANKIGYSPNINTPNIGIIDSNNMQSILQTFNGAAVDNMQFGNRDGFMNMNINNNYNPSFMNNFR